MPELEQKGGQRLIVIRLEQASLVPVSQQIHGSAGACRDHRQPARHRFQDGIAEALVERRLNVDVQAIEDIPHSIGVAEQVHLAGQTRLPDFALEPGTLRAFADQEQKGVSSPRP